VVATSVSGAIPLRTVLVVIVVFGAAAVRVAPAYAQCNPTQVDPQHRIDNNSYVWVGAQQNATGLTAAQSEIWNYQPYVPQGHFSYAWVMLTASGNYRWAQIGPHQVWNSRDIHIQTADGTLATVWDMNTSAKTLGTYTTVEALYTPNLYEFFVNGSYVAGRSLSWAPSSAQFYSEIPSWNTQLMGAYNNVETFYNSKSFYGGGWHTLTGTVTSTNGTYFKHGGTGSNFWTWDSACTN
jgi:hypothetical protein